MILSAIVAIRAERLLRTGVEQELETLSNYFGLTPKIFQSGLTKRSGRISKMGNVPMRSLLVQASMTFMRRSGECPLRDWALRIAQRQGAGKARVALARRLGVIMLTLWRNGETYMPNHPFGIVPPSS